MGDDQDELRDKRNDLLDIRGLLSPNGGEQVVPMELGDTVAPAVEWLIRDHTALTDQLAQIRRLHAGPRTERHGSGCVQCALVWPCPTALAAGWRNDSYDGEVSDAPGTDGV